MDASLPLLRWGSRGKEVGNLQSALNLWPGSHSAALTADGIFGPKTHSKVLEFQGAKRLVTDGIVGKHTWGALWSYLTQVLQSVEQGLQAVQSDSKVGARIVQSAEQALKRWGWPGRTVHEDPSSPYIAGARAADSHDPSDPRPRQGGRGLAEIFTRVGVPAGHCLKISRKAEHEWQHASFASVAWLNQHDLLDWCGIFCFYVYSMANIKVGGTLATWNSKKDLLDPTKFRHTRDLYQVVPGSIAINNKNHYRIVARNDPGHSVEFIEGNVQTPNQYDGNRYGMNSVMRRSQYTYKLLSQPQHSQDFFFPVNP